MRARRTGEQGMRGVRVRTELRSLSEDARLALRGWMANRVQVISGNGELEAEHVQLPQLAREYARLRVQATEVMFAEFKEIFG